MKINHIQADNFLRLNLFDVNMDDAIVHLFAGNNEAGKSSVQEAIRFALLGETVRVTTKGDYRLMIRDGAKKGTVGIRIDGNDIVRDIKTGKLTDEAMEEIHVPASLAYLIDAQHFGKLKQDLRRSFLIDLTGTQIKGPDIARRMKAKGVIEEYIEMILPMLRSGFTATHKEAYNRAAEARAKWTGLTGCQRYGSQIAANWKPTLPESFDHDGYLDKSQELDRMKETIGQLNIRKGGIVANLTNAREELSKVVEPVAFKQADLTKVNKDIKKAEKELAEKEIESKDLNDKFFNGKAKSPVTCCECGSLLKVEFTSKPGGERVAVCEPYNPMPEKEMNALQGEIFDVGANISRLKTALNKFREVAAKLEADKVASKGGQQETGVTQQDVDDLEADLGDINDKLSKLDDSYGDLNESVAIMRIVAEKIKDADEVERRAKTLHESVQEWEKAVEALAPDGIPAEILSDTLKPVNDRLRKTANLTGWPQVTIDPTMEVVVEGRRYSLLSESARWRADVAIVDAISQLSGLYCMIVDRMDVLDLKGRQSFMNWIAAIKDDYESILIFATLKTAPNLPAGMKSHWIANGEILETKKEDAA